MDNNVNIVLLWKEPFVHFLKAYFALKFDGFKAIEVIGSATLTEVCTRLDPLIIIIADPEMILTPNNPMQIRKLVEGDKRAQVIICPVMPFVEFINNKLVICSEVIEGRLIKTLHSIINLTSRKSYYILADLKPSKYFG